MFVFVVMPFKIPELYEDIIEPTLKAEGCEVVRGDIHDIPQNIVKDILHYLYQADLVIADLTGLNPNVFYELGLAHAFLKPTMLITQDDIKVKDLPFDLKSYRAYQYSFHHKDVDELKRRLRRLVQVFNEGKLTPQSPVTDFLPNYTTAITVPVPTEPGELLNKAEEAYYDQKDYQTALKFAEIALEVWPDSGRLREIAGRAALKLLKADNAIVHGEHLTSIEPSNWNGWDICGEGYRLRGNLANAGLLLRHAAKLAPNESKSFTFYRAGEAFTKLKENRDLAEEAYQNAISFANDDHMRGMATKKINDLKDILE